MEKLDIVNPEDKKYTDGHLWQVDIENGYDVSSFYVYADCVENALYIAVANAELTNSDILYDFDSIRDYVYTTFEDEYREWLQDKSGEYYSYDESWFDFATEYLGYMYVDATEQGASQPYFIEANNLQVFEVNDEPIVFENKKKEEIFDANVNVSTGDISSNLDLGGVGELLGMLASEEPKESEEKLEETRIPAQRLIDKYKDTDKVTFKDIKADLDSYSPEASDETIEGLMAQVKAGLEALGFKANETELVKESKSKKEETEDEVDDYGPYYVKEFNEGGTDIDTVGFDSEQEATDYAEKNIKKHPNHEYAVYETASDECLYLYDKTYFEESKSKKEEYYVMSDDEHIIWDSEIDYYDDDYMADVKENQYQDYLDNFEPSEPLSYEDWLDSEECYDNHYHWFEDSGIADGDWDGLVNLYDDYFKEDYAEYVENYKDEPLDFDKWYSNYIMDTSGDDWNILEDDLKENIFPAIDNQLVDNILLLSGNYGSNYPDFRSSGAGGVLWENGTDDFRAYMGGFDRVCITTQNGILGAICNDHDGTVSGQFYTLPENKTELIKALGYEEIIKERYDEEDLDKYNEMDLMETEFNSDLMYGGIDARDLNEHIDLLVPIKDTISGYTPNDPNGTKTESKEDQPTEEVIADFNFGKNWRAVITRCTNADDSDLVSFYDLSASKAKFPQGEDMDNTYSIDTLLMHKSDYTDNGATMYKDYTSRKFILSGEDMKDFFNKLDKIEGINYGKDFNTDDIDKYSTFDKEIRDLSKDKSNDKKYKQVVVTFGCDDCGHKEDWTFDDMFEWQLADLEASDSNNEVGDCPECGSMYYNMKDYKIIEESKKVEVESKNNRVYMVLGNYGNGWETVYSSENKEDAQARLKEYDDNEKEYPHKLMSKSADLFEKKEVKTEAEDMEQVKDEIETAVEKSDSTDLEKDQVKGSLNVLKADEESAIEGYEDFNAETEKVVDKELADTVKDQMEEIIDDEKEHIEKIDTIQQAIGNEDEKDIKTENVDTEIEKYSKYLDDNTKQHLKKLEDELLKIDNVTSVEYDLAPYADNMNSPIILVGYNNTDTSLMLLRSVIKTIQDNGLVVEMDELEDNDTYFYIVTYKNNWGKVEEAETKPSAEITEYHLANDKDNPVWITGYVLCNRRVYDVSGKVFIVGSKFGIDNGSISKLWIKDRQANKVICNYERGWDVKPTDKQQKVFKAICDLLVQYRDENPYEVMDVATESKEIKIENIDYKLDESQNIDGLLSQEEYDRIAKEVAAGNSIKASDMDKFLHDTERIKINEIKKKYNLDEQEASDLELAISYFDYLQNDGTIFTTIDSLMDCFTDMDETPIEDVTENTKKAFAEYILEADKLFVSLWDNEAVDRAREILGESKEIKTESKKNKKVESPADDAVNYFFNEMDKYMDSKGTDMEALKGIETSADNLAKYRPEFADMRYGDIYRALSKEYKTESKLTEAQLKNIDKLCESLKKENKTLKTEGVWLDKDNKAEFENGVIWTEVDIDPDYIEIDYENEDTDDEWLEKVMRSVQIKATDYDVTVMDLIEAPNGYSVVLKGTLQDIVDFLYDQKNYSIDKCIDDMDIEVSKTPITERLLGPSDETIKDSKEKGLYTENDEEPKVKRTAINIEWDTDGEDVDLPTEIEIPNDLEDDDEISDYITNQTGFCHKGFEIKEESKEIDNIKLENKTFKR